MAAAAKHTPGPWYLYVGEDGEAIAVSYQIKPGLRGSICRMPVASKDYGREEIDANARLIAASPELLEALKAIKATRGNCGASPFEQAACKLMDAAIAKAEGGEA